MKPRDDLFLLIQSLSKTEKATFTKASQRSGKTPEYLKLFQALAKLSQYDEEVFLESRAGKGFSGAFAVQKNELFEKILLVLRSQRQLGGSEKKLEFRLRERIEDIRLLWEKNLREQSKRRLEIAEKEAEKHEFYETFLELLRFKREIILFEQEKGYLETLELNYDRIEEALEILQNRYRLTRLRDKLFVLNRQHRELNGNLDHEMLDEVMEAQELKNISLCISFRARTDYHFCHSIYSHLKSDDRQAWIHFRNIYLMWQERKELQSALPSVYRNILHNYLSYCNQALRYYDFDKALRQLTSGKFSRKSQQAANLLNSLNIRIQKHLNLCEWEDAMKVFEEYQKQQEFFSLNIHKSRMLTFYISFSRLFAVEGNWASAKNWASMAVVEGDGNIENGLVLQGRLQEIMALFELGKVEALNKRTRSALSAFEKHKGDFEWEKSLVKLMEKNINQAEHKDFKKELKSLYEQRVSAEGKIETNDLFIMSWIASQLEGLSLKQIGEDYLKNDLQKVEAEDKYELMGFEKREAE